MVDIDKIQENRIATEQKIIYLMLKDRNAIGELIEGSFSPEFFDPSHFHIVTSIYQEYLSSKHKRTLTRDAYRQLLVNSNDRDVLHKLSIFDKCFIKFAKIDDLGYLKTQLQEGFLARESHQIFKHFKDDSLKGGYYVAAQNLIDKFQSILNATEVKKVLYSDFTELKSDFFSQFEYERNNPESIIKCGIPEIDDPINVGFRAGHLTLVVGPPGGYKTTIMLNIALHLYEKKHGILFIPLEMSWYDLLMKILVNRCGGYTDANGNKPINTQSLAHPNLLKDDAYEQIKNACIWEKSDGRFCILDGSERISVSTLRREIEKRIMAFRPKMIVIDYIDLMKTDVRYSMRTLEIGEMLKAVRAMGKEYKFSILSAAQMNRSAISALREGKEEALDSTSIHGSQSYAMDSDNVFAVSRIPDQDNKIKLHWIKCRYGKANQTKELIVDAARSIISSTEHQLITTSDSDFELAINKPVSEIEKSISQSSLPDLEFESSSLDELAELG